MLQSDLSKKILAEIQSKHQKFDEQSVISELKFMEENDVCKDIWGILSKVKKNPRLIGKENRINSLVCFLLGLTSQAPTASFSLVKRRTYARAGFPDIDMDFNHFRRHEIVEYLIEKYGKEHVSNIGTVQRLGIRSCLKRTISVLDPDHSVVFDENGNRIKNDRSENYQFQQRVVSTLPDQFILKKADGTKIESIEEAYNEFAAFREVMDAYPEIYRIAKKMEGGISAYSSHAAGYCLSPIPLARIAPLHITTGVEGENANYTDKKLATQFTAEDTESLGLIKFDVLGLLAKTVVTMASDIIHDRHGIRINVDKLPLDDSKTLKLLKECKTDGVFQLEEHGMQRTIKEIGIDSFNDLVAAIAMYRPGPLQFIPEYAQRKKNPSSVKYVHPIIEKHTKKTYGIICYQEQAMQIFTDLADLTPSEGYVFIKGAAKKKPEIFNAMKDRFIVGATKKANQHIAMEVWNWLQPFQGYAFNLSHACGYAYESWKTAYLKAHYPVEFMAARLSIAALDRKFDSVDKFESDCTRNLNITILPPDLNESKLNYTIVGQNTIRRPLSVKGIGEKAIEEIIKNQPYKGPDVVADFARKVGKSVNTGVVEVMCEFGLFGKIPKKKVVQIFDTVKSDRKKSKGQQTADLFG